MNDEAPASIGGLDEKVRRLVAERKRLEDEEVRVRAEALFELERIREQIEALELRQGQLEDFLGLDGSGQRAAHGQIQQLCIGVVAETGGLTSGQIRDRLEAQNPGMKLTSVASTLSRMVSQGRMRRDEDGRFYLA